jgi:hypothetical protein
MLRQRGSRASRRDMTISPSALLRKTVGPARCDRPGRGDAGGALAQREGRRQQQADAAD